MYKTICNCLFLFILFGASLFCEEERHVHGNCDFVLKNDYITPRGLLVSNTGLTLQILNILSIDVCQNKNGWLNQTTLFAGIWNDLWTEQKSSFAGAWNELDWFAGVSLQLYKNWKFSVQFLQFLSPPHHFKPENNIEFLLAYDDSHWENPIVLYPYIKWFWTVSGDSTVVTGRRGHTYDIEIGMVPTIDFAKYSKLPILISFPTWITVGPPSFWNGSELGLKHEKKNFGVFTVGVRGDLLLKCIPDSYGKWYAYVGYQYYYLINKNLLEAQVFTLSLSSIHEAHRRIGVGSFGIGFTF